VSKRLGKQGGRKPPSSVFPDVASVDRSFKT